MSTAKHRFRLIVFDVFLCQSLTYRPLSLNNVQQLTYHTSDRRPEAGEGIYAYSMSAETVTAITPSNLHLKPTDHLFKTTFDQPHTHPISH
jgi:hypothetical protein